MNPLNISVSRSSALNLKLKIALWSVFLTINFFLWYNRFFPIWESILLACILCLEIYGMLFVGYSKLGRKLQFPKLEFWSWVVFFSIVRFLMVYFIIQHEVPAHTVFKYPDRAIYFIFISSAALVYWGYSYSIYKWGLAARKKYTLGKSESVTKMEPIITIRSGGQNIHLIPNDILYLEAKSEYINYVCGHGNFMCFQRMKKAEEELRKLGFIRIHRSYIVNITHISSNNSSKVTLSNNLVLPVSKAYQDNLLQFLLKRDRN